LELIAMRNREAESVGLNSPTQPGGCMKQPEISFVGKRDSVVGGFGFVIIELASRERERPVM